MVRYAYGSDLLSIDSDFEIQGLKTQETTFTNVTIAKSTPLKRPKLEATNVFRAGLQAKYAFQEGMHFLEWPNAALFAIDAQNNIRYQSELQPDLLSLFVTNEVLGICLAQLGYTLLHAGAVEINGKACIFTGEPGTGKSTLIAALCKFGAKLLADDLSIVSSVENSFTCHLGLQESKLWKKSIEGLALQSLASKPMQEGHDKFYVDLPKSSLAKVPLESITFLTETSSNIALGLTQYYPLPHQILVGSKLKELFETNTALIKKGKLKTRKPFTNFHELEAWAQNFMKTYA